MYCFFLAVCLALMSPALAHAATYYIDWSAGVDSNNGTTTSTPWQHVPGDDSATSNANITLQPGDTVVLKGGVVYQGTATQNSARNVVWFNNGGTSGNPITLISGHRHSSAWGTGRAVIDGGGPGLGAAKNGIFIWNHPWIVVDGLEVRNIGVPTSQAGGIAIDPGGEIPGVDNIIIRYCHIHHVNWSGSYVIADGIGNGGGANNLYEHNEIDHVTDKLIETYGGGLETDGLDKASNVIIRYNVLHDAAIHCVVLTSDDGQVYSNIIYQCQNVTAPLTSGSFPGFGLKVDQGRRNKIFNNVFYEVNAGLGVLCGTANVFAHNVIYGIGTNGSGAHQGSDEAGFTFYNDGTGWSHPCVNGNIYDNNIVYYIPSATAPSYPKYLFHNADGGANNQVKNNIFMALSGDTASGSAYVRTDNATSGYGTLTYYTMQDWQAQFNTLFGGTGNVASGNLVVDPAFVGGTFGSLTNLPTALPTDCSLDQNGFMLNTGSPARISGIPLSAPITTDIQCITRSVFTPGIYEYLTTMPRHHKHQH